MVTHSLRRLARKGRIVEEEPVFIDATCAQRWHEIARSLRIGVGRSCVLADPRPAVEVGSCGVAIKAIVVDHAEPLDDRLHQVEELLEAYPMTPLIVCGLPHRASPGWSQVILRYLEAGATGYACFDDDPADLGKTIEAAISGELIVDPHIAADLLNRLVELNQAMRYQRKLPRAGPLPALTPRRAEILTLLADGHTNQEIAERLSIAVGTVKNHVHGILRTWQISSREQATDLYLTLQEHGTHPS